LPRDTEACESISELSASITGCVFALAVDVVVARGRALKALVGGMSRVHSARLDGGRVFYRGRIHVGHLEGRQSSVLLCDDSVRQHDHDVGRGEVGSDMGVREDGCREVMGRDKVGDGGLLGIHALQDREDKERLGNPESRAGMRPKCEEALALVIGGKLTLREKIDT